MPLLTAPAGATHPAPAPGQPPDQLAAQSPHQQGDAALISLVDPASGQQHHWWLPCGGAPPRIADLLGSPLWATGMGARTADELHAVFAPLPVLQPAEAQPASRVASYRYLLCLHPGSTRLSCWQSDALGGGWERCCAPMELSAFIARFGGPPGASS